MFAYISPPTHTDSRHTWFIYLRELVLRVFGMLLITTHKYSLIFKWNRGYYRHVSMSACRHGRTPLLYCRQPNKTYTCCGHVGMSACFNNNTTFLFRNIEWTILSLSACQHVGMSTYIPLHSTTHDIDGMSVGRHDLTPILYCQLPNMTYIWCRHVCMFW